MLEGDLPFYDVPKNMIMIIIGQEQMIMIIIGQE